MSESEVGSNSLVGRKALRVHFCDFWDTETHEQAFFRRILAKEYELIQDAQNPELLIYSLFGVEHKKFFCKKICFIGENVKPDFSECDYSISFEESSERNLYLPLWVLFADLDRITSPRDLSAFRPKTKFCNFLYSNPGPKERVEFFGLLSQYCQVDAGGRVCNNLGFRVQNKLDFLSDYKFTIAFENGSSQGYITEKLIQPLSVGSIPIYWGATNVNSDFNTKAFINVRDFESFEKAIEFVKEVDSNQQLFENMMQEPVLANRDVANRYSDSSILSFLRKVVEDDMQPVSTRNTRASLPHFARRILYKIDVMLFRVRTLIRKIKAFEFAKLKFRSGKTTLN